MKVRDSTDYVMAANLEYMTEILKEEEKKTDVPYYFFFFGAHVKRRISVQIKVISMFIFGII